MTRIIIDGVENVQDLYDALARVAHIFRNPLKFASAEERFFKRGHQPADPPTAPAAPAPEPPPLTPYVACPRRGEHLRLTDCWVCFADVHRGACLEVDAVSSEGWDVAMTRLTAVPDFPPSASEDRDREGESEWLTLPFDPADQGGEAA